MCGIILENAVEFM